MPITRALLVGALFVGAVPAVVMSSATVLGTGVRADSAVVRNVRSILGSGSLETPLTAGQNPERLADFYDDSTAAVLWVDGQRPTRAARALLEEIEGVAREGLEPERFHLSDIRGSFEHLKREGPTPLRQARTEVLVSAAFLALADALGRGAADPSGESAEWEREPDPVPGPELLHRIASGNPPPDVLDGLRPTFPWYGRLVDALARYRDLAREGGWPSVGSVEPLQVGDSSAVVARLRARLRAEPDRRTAALASRGDGAPAVFDPDLARAVERFQERHGIERDGVVGQETADAMNVGVEDRVEALRLNLDRLRRLPRTLGDRAILVNVAGFELSVLERDRAVLSMGVVVGQPETRTRIFRADLQYVVFNPYWHVPKSIARDEILPAVREDPSHLASNRLRVVPADDPLGEPLPTEDMDWDGVDVEAWPYVFRQDPGPTNSLGRIKFMFPNEHDIYLHDTPADHLFSRSFRAFSHGCIRVEDPRALARYVLERATDRPSADVDTLLERGETVQVDLTRPIPVFIVYLTTWVDEDGTVRFHRDPYRLDPEPDQPAPRPGRR